MNIIHGFNPILPFYDVSTLKRLCQDFQETESNPPGRSDRRLSKKAELIRHWMGEFQNLKLSDLKLIATLGIGGFGR